jgi:hypothetical protein
MCKDRNNSFNAFDSVLSFATIFKPLVFVDTHWAECCGIAMDKTVSESKSFLNDVSSLVCFFEQKVGKSEAECTRVVDVNPFNKRNVNSKDGDRRRQAPWQFVKDIQAGRSAPIGYPQGNKHWRKHTQGVLATLQDCGLPGGHSFDLWCSIGHQFMLFVWQKSRIPLKHLQQAYLK